MTVKEFQEKAVEGGWKPKWLTEKILEKEDDGFFAYYFVNRTLLDPKAWEAVGKVEGWKNIYGQRPTNKTAVWIQFDTEGWNYHMHQMIDALVKGKTIEQFLETL